MPARVRRRRLMAEMNVVPYIDVMLVLLVIFMVTAPMLQTGVQIDLPDAAAKTLTTDSQSGPLFVSVEANGRMTLEDGTHTPSLVDSTELAGQIAGQLSLEADRPVYIRADRRVTYDLIMQAMVAAQQAGATKIGLVADKSELSSDSDNQ